MALHLIERPNGQHFVTGDAGNIGEPLAESPWKYPTTATVNLATTPLHPQSIEDPGVPYTVPRSQ